MTLIMPKKIDLEKIEEYYVIESNGKVYSKLVNRYLSLQVNSCGYNTVVLPKMAHENRNGTYFVHSLVAAKYVGSRPKGFDIDHIDGDKTNNHHKNLQYITHSENIKRSFDMGRECYWKGKKKGPHSEETRLKMADAKKKQVKVIQDGSEVIYNSIEDCLTGLGWYRKKFNRKVISTYQDDNLYIERL